MSAPIDQRLAQLRSLAARLERLPESPSRDWALQEVRARIVDVETGHEPKAMRPLKEEPPEREPRHARKRASNGRPVEEPKPIPPRLQQAPPAPATGEGGLGTGDVLSLEDEEPPDTPADERWKRGLRG